MIKSILQDGLGSSTKAEITNNNALKVATIDYYNYLNEVRFFENPTNGANMAVDGSSVKGEVIHDGGDTSAWTGSNIAGTSFNFSDTTNPYAGTYHISATALVLNSTNQVKRGTEIKLDNYSSVSGWFNLTTTGNPNTVLEFYAYDTSLGTTVGNTVNIFDYINTGNTGVYQSFSIPLSDMGLNIQYIDAFRWTVSGPTGGTTFDLDDLTLNISSTGGGPQDYVLKSRRGEILVIDDLNFFVVDDYDGVTGQSGTPKLEYDKILGETLQNGIVYQRFNNNKILFSVSLRDISDFLNIPNMFIHNYFSDGTNTMMNIHYRFFEPFVMDSPDDKIQLTISDNLTGFLKFSVSSNCKSVVTTTGNTDDVGLPPTQGELVSYGS